MSAFRERMSAFFKPFVAELLIIFGFLFLLNNFLGNSETTINADGMGYYDYLPSIFIRSDFNRKDHPYRSDTALYRHIASQGIYVKYHHHYVDKYPVGTALLESPFFLYAKATTQLDKSASPGYQKAFQRTVFHAAIFYVFLALIFFRKLLELYDIKRMWIVALQLLMIFGTGVTHYASADAGFSHIYSLFAITAFAYFAKRYFSERNLKQFLWACVFLGLLILIRQINVLILLALPLFAGSWEALRNGFGLLFQRSQYFFSGIIIVASLCMIQVAAWYYQTGHFLVYSYQGERFYFDDPHFFDILFSYKKGLFIYTPLVFLATLGTLYWLVKKAYFQWVAWWFFFVALTYILSSWWSWFYGCSFGLRAYVDFYAILLIPLALVLNNIKPRMAVPLALVCFLTIPVNIIQSYQYKKFILHWMDMDERMYWEVFLKINSKYEGLEWKRVYEFDKLTNYYSVDLTEINAQKGTENKIYQLDLDSLPDKKALFLVQFSFDNTFPSSSETRIRLQITDTSERIIPCQFNVPLIQFREQPMGTYQHGVFNMEIPAIPDSSFHILSIFIKAEENVRLKHPKLNFFRPK